MSLTACGSDHPTAPAAETTPSTFLFGGDPKLLACPTNVTLADTAVVSLLGGLLDAAGTTVSIPTGALLEPQEFVLTVPKSNYMEIDVRATGFDTFSFLETVEVTIDYSRCNQSVLSSLRLSVWHIDSDSKELLERMPSVNNVLARRITFWTDHFSGYAIAY